MTAMTRVERSWLATTLTCLVGLIVLSVCLIIVHFGSIKGPLELLEGKVISASDADLAVDLTNSKVQSIEFPLRNLTFHDVTILGCGMACYGSPATKMPFVIRPGSSVPFSIHIPPYLKNPSTKSAETRVVQSSITIHCSDPQKSELVIPIRISVN